MSRYDDLSTLHLATLVREGVPERVAQMAVNRAAGVARAAVAGLPDHIVDEALEAKLQYELERSGDYARRFIESASEA